MAAVEQLITDNLDIWSTSVKAKSSVGRGNNKKLELYGIKKLRDLILGLGLSGALCDSTGEFDKPVDKLLAEIQSKYSKAKNKKLKEYRIGSPLLIEFDIPKNWEWKRVSDLCDLQTGATPSTQRPEYYGGDIRWLVSGDINQGIIEDCEGRITEEGLTSSNCKILPVGTVLIALNGQGKTRATVALLNVEAACNQSLVGMVPFDQIHLDPKFLLLALRYRYFEIRDITGQNQRRGLNMGLVAELSIPFPPIEVQRRVVAKVDELMDLCDQLEQQAEDSIAAHQTLVQTLLGTITSASEHEGFTKAWARIAEHFDTLLTTEWSIDQLKQTILQLAVMGKLIPQHPNDEPASELLKKIAAEKARLVKEGKIKKQKPLPPIGEDEKSFELPEGWAFARLTDVYDVRDGTHNTPKYQDGGYPLVTSKNLSSGKLDFSDIKYISEDDHKKIIERSKVDSNDILFAMIGSIGNPVLVDTDIEFSIKNVALFKYYSRELSNPYFLLRFLFFAEGVFRSQASGAVQSFVSLGKIRSFPLALPPLAEQHRIVAKVDELMAICDTLKSHLNTAQTTQLQLADAMAEQALC